MAITSGILLLLLLFDFLGWERTLFFIPFFGYDDGIIHQRQNLVLHSTHSTARGGIHIIIFVFFVIILFWIYQRAKRHWGGFSPGRDGTKAFRMGDQLDMGISLMDGWGSVDSIV